MSSLGLVSDSNGNATAIWVEKGQVKTATKPLYANWSYPVTLSYSGANSPVLCVDAVGDVVAAWVRNGSLETSTKFFGKPWQASATFVSGSASSPSIAMSGSGVNVRAVLLWQGTCGRVEQVYATSKFIMGGSWSPVQVISSFEHNAEGPSVAVDSNGNSLAIWHAYDIIGNSYTNVIVASAALPSSSFKWTPVSELSQPGIRDPSTLFASLAFDSTGNAIALWNTSFDDQTFTLETAVRPVDGNWRSPIDLVHSNLHTYSAALSATVFGNVLGLYMFYNGNSLQIQSVESNINGFLNNVWSVPVTISLGTNNAYPKIAASINGNVMHAGAVWVQYNGVNNSIMSSSGSKTLVLPATNLSVIQNERSSLFTEYDNTLSWDGSVDPNVIGYLIFRNGLFLEQVGLDLLQYTDKNREFDEPVTYSITAIDSQQAQSSAASISFP